MGDGRIKSEGGKDSGRIGENCFILPAVMIMSQRSYWSIAHPCFTYRREGAGKEGGSDEGGSEKAGRMGAVWMSAESGESGQGGSDQGRVSNQDIGRLKARR